MLGRDFRLVARNLLGDRVKRRIIIFESDDWGAQRMPSRSALASLSRVAGVGLNEFDENDCLESVDDLDILAEVLTAEYVGKQRKVPFTFNFVMGNPDFEGIRKSGFSRFKSVGLLQSYDHSGSGDVFSRMKELMGIGLASPQFHCLEHLNVSLWMDDLKRDFGPVRAAFDREYFGHMQSTSSEAQRHYLAAYHAISDEDLESKKRRLIRGLNEFERVFGYRSLTMVPCNYVMPARLEECLPRQGICGIQGAPIVKVPQVKKAGRLKIKRRFFRRSRRPSQLVRNVRFEPYEKSLADPVDMALREIEFAFKFRKPAIVSTHRVNYVGGISKANRDRSLCLLKQLIKRIFQEWPDVEFLTTEQFVQGF